MAAERKVQEVVIVGAARTLQEMGYTRVSSMAGLW